MQIPKKYQKALGNFAVMLALVWGSISMVPSIILILMPFLVGGVLAWLVNPVVELLEKKCKIKRKVGSALVIIAAIGGIIFFFYLVISNLIKESQKVMKRLPGLWNKMEIEFVAVTKDGAWLTEKLPQEMIVKIQEIGRVLEEEVTVMAGQMSLTVADTLANTASYIPRFLFAAMISLLSAYFLVAEKKEILSFFEGIVVEAWKKKFRKLKQTTIDVMTEYVKAQLKVEMWIYLLIALGFWILKINQWYWLALLVAIFDILPVLGTGIILLPWAGFQLIKGEYTMAVGLLAIWAISLLVRQIIQPKVLGAYVGMSPIPTLILLYVGYRLAGVAGMIGAVPLGMVVISMNKAGFFENCKRSIFLLWHGLREFCNFSEDD